MMNERNRIQEYTTGNRTVDAVGTMQINGNVIPHIWYKTIRRESKKPYLLAITILSDIVYWYRPVEERDELTGSLIGYRKRFRQDLLQRSYDQLSEMFGESKRSITDAVVYLEKLGVVKRVFRTIESGGLKCANVLFLDLDAETLYQITFPEYKPEPEKARPDLSESMPEQVSRSRDTGVPEHCGGCPENPGDPPHHMGRPLTHNRETNTKNITKSITENISSSSRGKVCCKMNAEIDEEVKQRIGYYQAQRKYPAAIVDTVLKEILKERSVMEKSELYSLLNPELFAEICKNILEYSGTIYNQPAFIKSCLTNISLASMRGRDSIGSSKFGFRQNNYNFEELERELMGLEHIAPG